MASHNVEMQCWITRLELAGYGYSLSLVTIWPRRTPNDHMSYFSSTSRDLSVSMPMSESTCIKKPARTHKKDQVHVKMRRRDEAKYILVTLHRKQAQALSLVKSLLAILAFHEANRKTSGLCIRLHTAWSQSAPLKSTLQGFKFPYVLSFTSFLSESVNNKQLCCCMQGWGEQQLLASWNWNTGTLHMQHSSQNHQDLSSFGPGIKTKLYASLGAANTSTLSMQLWKSFRNILCNLGHLGQRQAACKAKSASPLWQQGTQQGERQTSTLQIRRMSESVKIRVVKKLEIHIFLLGKNSADFTLGTFGS